jgi:hypothetical protein
MKPRAHIVHTLPGRLRLKMPEMRGKPDFFARVMDVLLAQRGIEAVRVNPLTGSVLILGAADADLKTVATQGQAAELFALADRPVQVQTGLQQARADLQQLSADLVGASRGGTDARSTMLALLLLGGLVQVARGELLAPASQLFIAAYQLLDPRPRPDEQ